MSWNLRPGPDGKERSYNPQGPYEPKKRFPVKHIRISGLPRRQRGYGQRSWGEAAQADIIYERFNKPDMLKEMRNDCPGFSDHKYNRNNTRKADLIEYWMKHGHPDRTGEFQRRSLQYEGRFQIHHLHYGGKHYPVSRSSRW